MIKSGGLSWLHLLVKESSPHVGVFYMSDGRHIKCECHALK